MDTSKIETSLENSQVVRNATPEGLRIWKFLLNGGTSLMKDGLGFPFKIIVKIIGAVENIETLKKSLNFSKSSIANTNVQKFWTPFQ